LAGVAFIAVDGDGWFIGAFWDSGHEPFGNVAITVTPDGQVSLRMPSPLEYLANARHGR
jgi:hypothetical protein